jgi:hypothetical protein
VNGTVVAAYTGFLTPPPLVTTASELLLFFESDYSVAYDGVAATYTIAPCPFNCSFATGGGVCVSPGACACAANATGIGCATPVCPNACSGNGFCDLGAGGCVCTGGYRGDDCAVAPAQPVWRSDTDPPAPRPLIGARGAYHAASDRVRQHSPSLLSSYHHDPPTTLPTSAPPDVNPPRVASAPANPHGPRLCGTACTASCI